MVMIWEYSFSSLEFFFFVFLLVSLTFFLKIMQSFNHALIILLTLEALSLTLFISLIFFNSTWLISSFILFVFMVLAVCEASLGLCLLIRLSRFSGNDILPL